MGELYEIYMKARDHKVKVAQKYYDDNFGDTSDEDDY